MSRMSRTSGSPPNSSADENAEISFEPDVAADNPLSAAQANFEARYIGREGIEGVGQGTDAIGNSALTVYVRDAGAAKDLPKRFEGYTVLIEIVGAIDAY